MIVLLIIAGYILCGLLSWALDWLSWEKLKKGGEVVKYSNGGIVYIRERWKTTIAFKYHMYLGLFALLSTLFVFILRLEP